MAGEGQRQIFRRHPATVIHHPNQVDASLLDVDVDSMGAGVRRVFHELLDHARRPLDNLPRGDLGDDRRPQFVDPSHASSLKTSLIGSGLMSTVERLGTRSIFIWYGTIRAYLLTLLGIV